MWTRVGKRAHSIPRLLTSTPPWLSRCLLLAALGCTLDRYQESMAVRHYRGLDTDGCTSRVMCHSSTWYKASPPRHVFFPYAFPWYNSHLSWNRASSVASFFNLLLIRIHESSHFSSRCRRQPMNLLTPLPRAFCRLPDRHGQICSSGSRELLSPMILEKCTQNGRNQSR